MGDQSSKGDPFRTIDELAGLLVEIDERLILLETAFNRLLKREAGFSERETNEVMKAAAEIFHAKYPLITSSKILVNPKKASGRR